MFDPAAQRVREELFRDRPHELVTLSDQDALETVGALKPATIWQGGRCINGCVRLGRAPSSNRIEILERETQRVHRRMTDGARRILPVLLQPLTHGGRL